jgi:hypothetical protein
MPPCATLCVYCCFVVLVVLNAIGDSARDGALTQSRSRHSHCREHQDGPDVQGSAAATAGRATAAIPTSTVPTGRCGAYSDCRLRRRTLAPCRTGD